MQRFQPALFAVLACFWGGSFVAIKFALETLSVPMAVLIRVGIGMVFTGVFCLILRKPFRVSWAMIPSLFFTGCLAQAFPFLLLFKAEQAVSAGLAGIINGTVPLFAGFLSAFVIGKSDVRSKTNAIGLCIGYFGVALICVPALTGSVSADQLLGIGLLFLMAISYALGSICAKSIAVRWKVSVYTASFWYHLGSFLLLGAVTLLSGELQKFEISAISEVSLLSIVYLGFFSNALAFIIFYYLIESWGATRATTVTYVVPGVAILFDFHFFGARPHALHIAGWLTVMLGLWLSHRPVRQTVAPSLSKSA